MTTKLRKWGNGYGILIPKYQIEELGAKEGTTFLIEVKDSKMILKKEKNKLTLEDLIKNFDPKTKHDEVDWGYAVGKEIIDDEYSK